MSGRAALVSLGVDPLLLRGVAECDHAALAGGELLVGVEPEHGRMATPADGRPVGVLSSERLTGVLDDREAVAGRQLLERGHVGGVAEDVDRQQRAGSLGDDGGGGLRVEVERQRVDVGEHRPRAAHTRRHWLRPRTRGGS